MFLDPFLVKHWPYAASLQAHTWLNANRRLQSLNLTPSKMTILDLGCGGFYPYTVLYHSLGANVTGVDMTKVRPITNDWTTFRTDVAQRGVGHGVRRLLGDMLKRVLYYDPLGRACGVKIRHAGVNLVTADAACLGIPDQSVDLVISFAAVEHFLNIPQVAAEIHRVLKPDGIAHLNIHLWTSLSGGHEKEFWNGGVPPTLNIPWQHLRDPNWVSDIPLNRWREKDYLKEFMRSFALVRCETESELGRHLITDEILSALPEYSVDELAKEMLVLILRKPSQ